MTTRLDRRCWLIIGLAVACCMAAAPSTYADTPPTPLTTPARQDLSDLRDLTSPAAIEELVRELKANHEQLDPLVADLVGSLETFRQHRLDDLQERSEAKEKALVVMTERRLAGRLKEALGAALEAAGQSLDTQTLIADPRVLELVEHTEQAATKATSQGDWLEVASLYRRLNLLFDPESPYRDEYERAEQRVTILSVYAPDKLVQMLQRREADDAQEQDGAAEVDLPDANIPAGDTWEEALKNVEFKMLAEAIRGARRHVSSPEPRQLLLGAIDRLLLFIDVDGLGQTFPALSDPAKARSFRSFLRRKRREIEEAHFGLFRDPTEKLLKDVLAYSQKHSMIPRNVLVYEMGQGAIGTLDKFSEVIWPYYKEQLERSTQGEFTGVGIQIRLSEDNRITVVTPIRKTPAFDAGIRHGDVIVRVDDRDTTDWSLDKAVHAITGPEGTPVTLGIERPGQQELLQVRLVRARVPIESVWGWQLKPNNEWDYHIDRTNQIGYIRLTQFVPQSADDLDLAIEQMRQSHGLKGLILDLRFNPGGLLRQAVEVANRFVPEGRIVSIVNADRQQRSELRAWPDKAYEKMEVVVLVNRTSASASEIVAGALQDYGRATIIGTRTYGKGSVQDVYPLYRDRGYLKLTTQYYMLPGKRIIHREPNARSWGIDPGLVVQATDQQVVEALDLRREADVLYATGSTPNPLAERVSPQAILDKSVDPQLEAALLVIKTRLMADRIRMAQSKRPADTP